MRPTGPCRGRTGRSATTRKTLTALTAQPETTRPADATVASAAYQQILAVFIAATTGPTNRHLRQPGGFRPQPPAAAGGSQRLTASVVPGRVAARHELGQCHDVGVDHEPCGRRADLVTTVVILPLGTRVVGRADDAGDGGQTPGQPWFTPALNGQG